MAKHVRRALGVIALAAATFFVVGQLVSMANMPPWTDIGQPPEGASAIAATWPDLVVLSREGHAFKYCGDGCWEAESSPAAQSYPEWITPNCPAVKPPPLPNAGGLQVECRYIYGAAVTYVAYATDANGHVFLWQETVGDMSWLEVFPPAAIAAAAVAVLGFALVATFALKDALDRLGQNASSQGRQPRNQ